jgi:predicted secreted protein
MNTEEFKSLLSSHDWYYMYSDDHRAWSKGAREWDAIAAAMKGNEKLREVYEKYVEEKDI